MRFLSRLSAGRELATALRPFASQGSVVFALPRGGVIVGAASARILNLPLDLLLVRKIGHPANPEYAVGAIAEDGQPVYDYGAAALDADWLDGAEQAAHRLIEHRRQLYFGMSFPHPAISGRTALIIDDGMATGLTMLAAVKAMRIRHPHKIIAAVPVASRSSIDLLADLVDGLVVLDDPGRFGSSVGTHYASFPQVDDNKVKNTLERSRRYAIRQNITINSKT